MVVANRKKADTPALLRAFTLVELLVVISIIALLLSILMPALNKVREQARTLTCAAGAKQIATIAILYQSDNGGNVPVVMNRWVGNGSYIDSKMNQNFPIPASARLLSVALRSYSGQSSSLDADPQLGTASKFGWGYPQDTLRLNAYYKKYMPKFFSCPFVRGKAADATILRSQATINGKVFKVRKYAGGGESFSTCMWEVPKGDPVTADNPHPFAAPYGTPKFGQLTWNSSRDMNYSTDYGKLKYSPAKWDSRRLARVRAGGLTNAVVAFCDAGQFDAYCQGSNADNGIFNYNSHKKAKGGGTDVILADGHVEWAEGERVGWP